MNLLAACGSWRAVASLSERLLSQSHPIDALLRIRWAFIVSLLKLKDVPRAEREMAMLGDLRSTGWLYERYPAVYPNRIGSMVPFALFLLHALLPAYSGKHEHALARLYALLASGDGTCTPGTEEEAKGVGARGGGAKRAGAVGGANSEASRRSLSRRASVLLAISNVLCALHDYPNAIAHVEQLVAAVRAAPPATASDVHDEALPTLARLYSLLGRLHLQLGNLAAAEDACSRLGARASAARSHAGMRACSLAPLCPSVSTRRRCVRFA